MERIKIRYRQRVPIPKELGQYFWDEYPEPGKTHLEKFILRILTYGNSDEIGRIANLYPDQVQEIIDRYRERLPLYRGLKVFTSRRPD